jgi:predicted nuclease of predicted toxin-antitoxin system
VRILVDTQLPRLLANCLREQGHDVVHVLDLSLSQASDNEIWEYAISKDLMILTKDGDFAEWVVAGRAGPRVIWLRIGNCTNRELIDWLIPALPEIETALGIGDRLVEVAW